MNRTKTNFFTNNSQFTTMKSNLVFAILMAVLVVGVCCNGNVKVKVNGRPVWGDDFVMDSSNITRAKKVVVPTPNTPGDTTKIGIVLDCTRCIDKTVSTTLDGVIWTGYKVRVKISETATATKFLMPDKTPLPKGCRIIQVIKLGQ